VKKLRGALEQHIRKEEQEIWPKIEQVWDMDRLEEAGRKLAAMKREEIANAR
jgi:iron-sulfur cluster repair protein YtfE (RIC family)